MASVVSGGISARLSASAASILFPNRSGPGICVSSKLQTRARICEAGLYAAQARKRPSAARTSTVSPLRGAPRTSPIAPEKIHGWRRRSERSRPGFSASCGAALTSERWLDPAGEADQPSRAKQPEGMDPRRQDDGRSDGRRRESRPRVVGGESDEVSAGEHQTDGHRDKAVLDGGAPACAPKTLPDSRDGERQHARRPANGRSRHYRSGQSRHFPADQADHENIRPGRRLGEREQLGELRAAHPSVNLHDAAMHFGKDGDRPADRDQRQNGEIHRKLRQGFFVHFALQSVAMTLKGATLSRKRTRGRRMSAMPMRVNTANDAIAERSRRLAAILRPMATTRPAAAAEIPRNTAETAGRLPYSV